LNRIDKKLSFAVVHLGKVPIHVRKNVEYLAQYFSQRFLFVITDQEDCSWLSGKGITVVRVNELIENWPTEFEINDKRQYFRENFWFSSKARLLLLPKLMEKYDLEKLLHIESDVWIHPDFPIDYFCGVQEPLAFSRIDHHRGIASILFINGEQGCKLLNLSCLEWPRLTDMEILGKMLESKMNILELTTYEYEKDTGGSWIFDGAKMGMYLFGSDPRNSWGLIRRFRKSPMGGLLDGDSIEFNCGYLMIRSAIRQKRIANLHLHSKNHSMYSEKWDLILIDQLNKERKGYVYGFSINGLVFKVVEYWRLGVRKIARKLKESGISE
jgi:hypothetical protein